jgi:formyltetrahydrofolate deformylase
MRDFRQAPEPPSSRFAPPLAAGAPAPNAPAPQAKSDTGTLLVSCPDRRGLVAALAQLLAGHGANILTADQHRDPQVGQFFQRISFDLGELLTDRGTLERALGEVSARFGMNLRLYYDRQVTKAAVFVSQYDHCLYDLLWRQRSGELPCEIPLIISNKGDLAQVAAQFQIPFFKYEISAANKAEQEEQELALLREHGVELVVLARYMQILSPSFVSELSSRIINIHHSFLPAFVGGKPYHQAAERGVKLIGATAHYVTADLDEGPIIEQDVIRATHKDSIQDLIRKGRDVERSVLSRAVRWHLEHRVLVHENRTVVFE